MQGFNLPVSPLDSKLGWPAPKRLEEFAERRKAPGLPTFRVVFEGQNKDLPMIRVPIALPKYRLMNGRTVSGQEEYLAKHPSVRRDLFTGDPELLDAQYAQHEILLSMADQADLKQFFRDASNKQVQPLLLDEHGFVVNGNRRLATWRMLLEEDLRKYEHFANVDAVVLPHCDEREIDRIEASLQIKKDIQAEYSWDARANMMYVKRKRFDLSDHDLAGQYGMSQSDVREFLEMREVAVDFLKQQGQENLWSNVSGSEFAFRRYVQSRKKLQTAGEKELFRQTAFSLIAKASDSGRLYQLVSEAQESLVTIKEKLTERFSVEPEVGASDLEGLFGGADPVARENATDIRLATEIRKPENADEAVSIIVETIESLRQLKKDTKDQRFLINCLAKARSALTAAVKQGLRPDSATAGVAEHLAGLKSDLAIIERWFKEHD